MTNSGDWDDKICQDDGGGAEKIRGQAAHAPRCFGIIIRTTSTYTHAVDGTGSPSGIGERSAHMPGDSGNQFREDDMRKQKGFSLIELLIVVAIILIIAAIAIPNLLRSRIAANEASAVGSVRTINTAEVTYSSTYPDIGFADTLLKLGPSSVSDTCAAPTSASACIVDWVIANSATTAKSGYKLSVTGSVGSGGTVFTNYFTEAHPATKGTSGIRTFCSDQSGVIRYDPAGTTFADEAACLAKNPLQ
jgi:type IV pilus assembly protein PilA